jgi:putative hydrolase of the HAD superfamily
MYQPYGYIYRLRERNSEEGATMLRGVLFDLGNTVVLFPALGVETEELSSERKSMLESLVSVMYDSLKDHGLRVGWRSFFEAYRAVRSEQLERQRQTLKEYDMKERLTKVLESLDFNASASSEIVRQALDAYFESYVRHVEMEKEVVPTLRSLLPRYRLGIVTNFAYPRGIHMILGKFGLEKIFDPIVISGEVGWIKPSPIIFQVALSKLRLSADQVAFVGDDPETDIKGAKNVGMKTVFLARESTRCDADITTPHLSSLTTAIEGLEAR